MPPLSTDHVKLLVKESDIDLKLVDDCATNACQDGWLEKAFDRQEDVKTSEPKKHKQNFIQRVFDTLTHHNSKKETKGSIDAYDENCYNEELQQYIAEATANLRYDDALLDSSDEETSDEDCDPVSTSPRNAEIIDYSASIVSISSDKTDEYVEPPVEVPQKYRSQDRHGGVLVAGHYVLFTNWAFKRKMRDMGRLGPLPERGEAFQPSVDEIVEVVTMGRYSGKIVEL
ncbi:hypothetical protein PHPALM_27749 [Phytophthora palmivora]|uniref:Uncharacterized protein n=1 Tax=Phytophthora palmivora TaxID=4796 RepID=A0A2P4XBV1_9STRA|nr:hypothetical protein PHPALM_27749 [Phytophthora palmivora]